MTMTYDDTLNRLQRAADRTERAQSARPRRTQLQRTMGNAAQSLSRRAAAQREAGVCNAALHALVDLCYELDDNGQLVNVDPDTGRILIPMPTGRSHYQAYGLASTHQRALRAAMLAWSREEEPAPLFIYEPLNRRWYLCTWSYPTLRHARRWLDARQMTAALWLGVRS